MAEARLEIDGSTHWDDDAQLRDAARDRWLAAQGVDVIRTPASRIYRDIHGVMDQILLKNDELKRGRKA